MKESRLLNLPPAARVALISKKILDGLLKIRICYVTSPRKLGTFWIGLGQELDGVPYERWLAHAGKIVRLWEWEGTGQGMIGGPAKRQVGSIWWGGAAEFPLSFSTEECLETARRLDDWLADERYEFSDSNREDVLDQIYKLRMPREWQRANRFYISPRRLKRIAEMEEAESREGENL